MDAQSDSWTYRNAPCQVCGKNDFVWGYVITRLATSLSVGSPRVVLPDDSFFQQLGGRPTTHRICRTCGAIQAFLSEPLS